MNNLIIRNATRGEMIFFVDVAKNEGWNPGLEDASPFFDTDPDGFFVALLDGKIIGSISAVAYNSHFGFMGFYIILPEFRGQGYGYQLWSHAIRYLGNRTIGLDGVVEQQNNYAKSGFQFAYNNIRFAGKLKKTHGNPHLKEVGASSFDALIDYDASIFCFKRERFLKKWLTMANSHTLMKRANDEILGYGVVRRCYNGFKIGPLFANDAPTAQELFEGLVHSAGEGMIFLDVPQINSEAMKLAEIYHLKPSFQTARMYKGAAPKQELEKVFGVTSFELG